jgi:hypothetical protein
MRTPRSPSAAADWEPLLGLLGLARFLAPAPGT